MKSYKLILNYLVHRISSLAGNHSDAFIHDFKRNILRKPAFHPDFERIEKTRSSSLYDPSLMEMNGFGAGSRRSGKKRTIGRITRISSVNAEYGRLLYRLASYYKPSQIIEFGTATGISTMYLACGYPAAKVITVEGNPGLAAIAENNFKTANIKNITILNKSFDEVLPQIVVNLSPDSLVFIDGNHREESTLHYFSSFTADRGKMPIIVLDDINWSAGMRCAWKKIRHQASEGIIVDLFFMGIYFGNINSPLQFVRMIY